MFNNLESDAPLVPAVFANREQAAVAVAALREFKIDDQDIGLAVPVRETNRLREDAAGDVAAGAGRGVAVGGSLGAVGGISLMALTAGELLALGVGGLLAVGTGGLLWGGVIGGLIGVITRVRRRPDVDRWCELELDKDAVLVVVRVRDWSHEGDVAALLERAGATAVLDHLDLDHSWRELEVEHHSGSPLPGRQSAVGPVD